MERQVTDLILTFQVISGIIFVLLVEMYGFASRLILPGHPTEQKDAHEVGYGVDHGVIANVSGFGWQHKSRPDDRRRLLVHEGQEVFLGPAH